MSIDQVVHIFVALRILDIMLIIEPRANSVHEARVARNKLTASRRRGEICWGTRGCARRGNREVPLTRCL
jgi:hypothetical protein